jgi:hypothetical protein
VRWRRWLALASLSLSGWRWRRWLALASLSLSAVSRKTNRVSNPCSKTSDFIALLFVGARCGAIDVTSANEIVSWRFLALALGYRKQRSVF